MNNRAMMLTMLAVGLMAAAPLVAAGHVEPTFVQGHGTTTCSDLQPEGEHWDELTIDPVRTDIYAHGSGDLTILLAVEHHDEDGPTSFHWTATHGEVVAVFSTGGHTLYEYPGGATSDTDLKPSHANGDATDGISFCFVGDGGDEPGSRCPPGELAARTAGDGRVTVDASNLNGDASLLRSTGDGAPAKVADLNETSPQYVDTDTAVGETYTYTLLIDDRWCDSIEMTAIPVLPSIVAGALAVTTWVTGYVVLRRP